MTLNLYLVDFDSCPVSLLNPA